MSAPQTIPFRPVKAGRLTGSLLGFARARVLRHETAEGISLALLPRSATPDFCLRRGEVVNDAQLQSLRAQFVLSYNGLHTFTDDRGGEYLAVPVAKIAPGAS